MIKNIFYCKINLYQLTVDFCTSDKGTTPPQIKFKRTQKFKPKILVWIVVSESGILKPFFSKQKQSVNQTTDLDKCIYYITFDAIYPELSYQRKGIALA